MREMDCLFGLIGTGIESSSSSSLPALGMVLALTPLTLIQVIGLKLASLTEVCRIYNPRYLALRGLLGWKQSLLGSWYPSDREENLGQIVVEISFVLYDR